MLRIAISLLHREFEEVITLPLIFYKDGENQVETPVGKPSPYPGNGQGGSPSPTAAYYYEYETRNTITPRFKNPTLQQGLP